MKKQIVFLMTDTTCEGAWDFKRERFQFYRSGYSKRDDGDRLGKASGS